MFYLLVKNHSLFVIVHLNQLCVLINWFGGLLCEIQCTYYKYGCLLRLICFYHLQY